MTATAATVRTLVDRIPVLDDVSEQHHGLATDWLASTEDIFRREPPDTPAPHLVGYFAVVDPGSGDLLLVDHRRSGLWLPAGGHVDPGEHPADTVRREVLEELGVPARFALPDPVLLTWTPTVGLRSHVDVSLWFVLALPAAMPLVWDRREFHGVRWFEREEASALPPGSAEPHLPRLVRALAAVGL